MKQNAFVIGATAFALCIALTGLSGCQTNKPREVEDATSVTNVPREVKRTSSVPNEPRKVEHASSVPRPVTQILTVRAKKLTGLNSFSLENSLSEARRQGTTTMIVDVNAVIYAAEPGIEALASGNRLFGRDNFALVNLSDELRAFLDANAPDQFQIFDSSDSAIAELRYSAIPVPVSANAAAEAAEPEIPATTSPDASGGLASRQDLAATSVSAEDNRTILQRRSEEERIREKKRARTRTVSQGAAFMGIIGAITGAVLMNDSARGALIGGGVGALTGTIAGSYIADKQEQYGDELDVLESMTADVRTAQTQLVQDIGLIEYVIEDQRREIADLKIDLEAQRITQEQYQAKLASLENDREQVRTIAGSSRKELEKFQKASALYVDQNPSRNPATLDNEIGIYGASIEELDALTSHLDSLGQAV